MKQFWGAVGGLAAVAALVWGVFIWFHPAPSADPQGTQIAVAPPSALSSPETLSAPARSSAPPSSTASAQQVDVPAPPVMNQILVESGYSNEAVPCCMVGKNLFQLADNGKASFGYHWSSRLSDGTENTSKDCQILVTVTGPENPPSLRVMDCTTRRSNTFTGYGNYALVATPGEYVVTVTDELSGVTGAVTVTVIS